MPYRVQVPGAVDTVRTLQEWAPTAARMAGRTPVGGLLGELTAQRLEGQEQADLLALLLAAVPLGMGRGRGGVGRAARGARTAATQWTREQLAERGAAAIDVDRATGAIRAFQKGPYLVEERLPGSGEWVVSRGMPSGQPFYYGIQPSIDAVFRMIDAIGMDLD